MKNTFAPANNYLSLGQKIAAVIVFAALVLLANLAIRTLGAQRASAATPCPAGTGDTATTTVSVASTATYTFWSRIQIPDSSHTGYYLEVDGDCVGAIGGLSTLAPNTWTWVDYLNGTTTSKASRSLSSGSHTVKMIGKDLGVKVDRVLFVTDGCTPSSTGDNCTIAADTTAPTVPTGLNSPSKTSSSVNLAWTASTDAVGVTGYKIFRGGTQIGTSTSTTYSATGLSASTSYSFTVAAYDAAGNTSAQSSALSVTTSAASSGGADAEAMKGVWAVKQLNKQSGTGSAFDSNTLNADIAGFSARIPWSLVQTGQSSYNWTAFDSLVNTAKAKGKSVRLSVMSGANAPAQGGWLNYQYPWFKGSDDSQCDSAKVDIPVPWDSGLLNAQTSLINEMARKWKADWGSTVVALQITGPSAKWEELCLPNNTVDLTSQGYYYNSRTDNIIRKTWANTMDKWNTALTSQGIGSNRVFISLSAQPPFYNNLPDDVGSDALAKFGSRVSFQWHFLDVGFSTAVNSVTNNWKSRAMVAWQEWGATTFASRLLGTGGGAACNTAQAADCDTTTASNQDVLALNASINLAKNAGSSYVEVYDDDLKFPLLSAAAATIHATMKGTVTPPSTKQGDINNDSKVDIYDLSILLANYGTSGSNISSDIDKNGTVNITDLSILLSKWGT